MKNSVILKAGSRSVQHPFSRVVCLGLLVLGVHLAASEIAHGAEPGSKPTIAFGQTLQGALGDANDLRFNDGKPVDDYRVVVEKAKQPYVITASSAQFPVISKVFFVDAQQQTVQLQGAWVLDPKQQVQYSGVFDQPGEYIVQIHSFAAEMQQGSYSLSLTEAAVGGSGCAAASADAPIDIALNQPLNCELSSKDIQLKLQDGVHFAKWFRAKTGSYSFRVEASGFKARIEFLDSNGKFIDATAGLPPGDIFFVVTSIVPEASGKFTVTLESQTKAAP